MSLPNLGENTMMKQLMIALITSTLITHPGAASQSKPKPETAKVEKSYCKGDMFLTVLTISWLATLAAGFGLGVRYARDKAKSEDNSKCNPKR
jgi:hypothetical protein